ncbi:MAG: ATP-binding protein [Gemmatimonadales bacterium]
MADTQAPGTELSPRAVLTWLAVLAAVTAALVVLRGQLDKAHMALAFLLVVLGASARSGRRTGLLVAVLAFCCFDFLLLPPYYTFVLADDRDWFVLLAFLATGAVAAQLLDRAQREAGFARRRAEEIERLSALGAATLSAPRAADAVMAIARVIQATLAIDRCEIVADPPDHDARPGPDTPAGAPVGGDLRALMPYVAEHGVVATRRSDGTTHVGSITGEPLSQVLAAHPEASGLIYPLLSGGVNRGLLCLANRDGLRLDPARRRFADALAYYAALGVERMHLARDAQHAQELREADRLKDALLASVSHDLRTPLTTIKGLAQEIWRSGDDRAAVIEEEADRLERLVADLLDLSQIDSGLRVEPELNAAEDLVGVAVQRAGGALAGHELRVRLPPMADLLVGRFDMAHSTRILVNLLENAAKYSPTGTPIDLDVAREGEMLTFQVGDRGPGVPDAERERIFEPFHRLATVPPTAGSGLGLAIARRLAEAQGGTVRQRARPGGGSLFELHLPTAEVPTTIP